MKYILLSLLAISPLFFEASTYAVTRIYMQRPIQVSLTRDITSFEEACHEEINKVRKEHNLQPLNWWSQLSDCAREHSQNMANGKCLFGHNGFEKRAKDMRKIVRLSFFGENVAYSHNYEDPVKIAVESWMKSDGHRKNILANFQETGIGVALTKEGKCYITQLFATRD